MSEQPKDGTLLAAAINAHAALTALYHWREMVRAAGGVTCISGVAQANAMFASMDKQKARFDRLITEPLMVEIEKAKERQA